MAKSACWRERLKAERSSFLLDRFALGMGLDALVDEAGEGFRVDEAFAVGGVVFGGGFCGDRLLYGVALFLESGYGIADGDEHQVVGGELGFVADGAVAGDEDGVLGAGGQVALGGADHAVDVSSGRVVDEGEGPVEPGVAAMEDVGVGEECGDIGIGVGWVVVGEDEGCAVGGDGVGVGEGFGGKSSGG